MNVKKIIKYFLSGLIFLLPFFIMWQIFYSISEITKFFIPKIETTIAFTISTIFILTLGYLISKFFKNSLRSKIIKKSKNSALASSFFKILINYKNISEKTKTSFSKPIFYQSSEGIEKIGFITNDDFDFHKDKIAVYVPNPISLSGELIFIKKELIRKIPKEDKHNILITIATAGLIHKDNII